MIKIVVLVVAGVLLLAGFVTGLVCFILLLVKSVSGAAGGWRRLAEVYASSNPPSGQIIERETIMVGAVTYKRCTTLGVADEGLYVSIWGRTALIPWTEFKALGHTTLYWQKVPLLTIGDPPVATLTLPVSLFQSVRGRLPA